MEGKSKVIEKLIQSQNATIEDLSKLANSFEKLNTTINSLKDSIISEDILSSIVEKLSKLEEISMKINEIEERMRILDTIRESIDRVEDISEKLTQPIESANSKE
ncbi:MAG: hypothetical protein KGZ84_08340 [Erysipelotrichia bacterium]|jgi:DNA repair ATPase RecN|nr:hypothetical protein [Erysipelotrichia bacterium]